MSTTSSVPAVAPLDHHRSQRIFRVLLDALCRPGRPMVLDAAITGDVALPPALLVPLALAGVEVGLAVLTAPESPGWASSIAAVTGAATVALDRADMVVALRTPTVEEIRSVRQGSDETPELGARLVLSCTDLAEAAEVGHGRRVVLGIEGPGVPGRCHLGVDGLPSELFEAIVPMNRRFPEGVDTFLVSDTGLVSGIPRSSRVRIEQGSSAWDTQR